MSAAHINAAPRVVGKKLRPFTLGHQALLEAMGSPLAVGATHSPQSFEEEYFDLLISVYICSLDFRAALVSVSFPWIMRAHVWLWSKRVGHFDLNEESAKFADYIKESTQEPRFWIDDKHASDSESGVPWLQFLKQKNMELLGLKESECLELPYKAALDTWLTHLANSGAIRFWTERDYRLVALAQGKEALN
jgi:hypothetical protein